MLPSKSQSETTLNASLTQTALLRSLPVAGWWTSESPLDESISQIGICIWVVAETQGEKKKKKKLGEQMACLKQRISPHNSRPWSFLYKYCN